MFEKLKRFFRRNTKSGDTLKKRNKDSQDSATAVTDDSLGNVAGGQSRPDPKKTN